MPTAYDTVSRGDALLSSLSFVSIFSTMVGAVVEYCPHLTVKYSNFFCLSPLPVGRLLNSSSMSQSSSASVFARGCWDNVPS